MHGAATGLIAIALGWDRRCARIGVRPPGHGLPLGVWAKILALEVPQLVLRAKILGRKTWAAFEPNHFHARLAKLGREDPSCCAYPDNDDIGFLDRHGCISSPADWSDG